MSKPLFRRQVYEAQFRRSSEFGDVAVSVPSAWSIIVWIVLAFLVALLLFLTFTEIISRETVRGTLRYADAEAQIVSGAPGTMMNCQVHNGQSVYPGQSLITVETERFLVQGHALAESEIASIASEVQGLEVLLDKISARAEVERELTLAEISKSKSQLVRQRQQLNLNEDVVTMARQRVRDARQDLAEGLIPRTVLDARVDELAQAEQASIRSRTEIERLTSDIQSGPLRLEQVKLAHQEEEARLKQTIAQTKAALTRKNADRAYVLKSPVAGIATGSVCRVGEAVEPGSTLLTIVPKGSRLIGELRVPARAIAFVRQGQPVQLRYDAFPVQRFGVFDGTISEVTSTTSDVISGQTIEPVYKVVVEIEAQAVDLNSESIELKSGMQFTADIVLGRRRTIMWLLAPLRQ